MLESSAKQWSSIDWQWTQKKQQWFLGGSRWIVVWKWMENVRKPTYLGVILSEDGRLECDLEKRIGAALSIWCGILGTKGEGETKNSSSWDETVKENCRSEANGSCEKWWCQSAVKAGRSCGAGGQKKRGLEETGRRANWSMTEMVISRAVPGKQPKWRPRRWWSDAYWLTPRSRLL